MHNGKLQSLSPSHRAWIKESAVQHNKDRDNATAAAVWLTHYGCAARKTEPVQMLGLPLVRRVSSCGSASAWGQPPSRFVLEQNDLAATGQTLPPYFIGELYSGSSHKSGGLFVAHLQLLGNILLRTWRAAWRLQN